MTGGSVPPHLYSFQATVLSAIGAARSPTCGQSHAARVLGYANPALPSAPSRSVSIAKFTVPSFP